MTGLAALAQRTVLLGAVAVAVLWLAMAMSYPLGWDQGLFAWVGNAIVQGGMPYRDAWDFKGPLVYYTFALAQWLFGVHLWSIRVLDAALLFAGTFAIHRSVVVMADAVTARWAALLFFLWYASHSYWHTAQPDGWTGLLLIVALAPLVSRPAAAGPVALAFAGACIGIATLFKPTNALFLALPIAHLVVSKATGATGRARPFALSAAVIAGWAAPVAAIAGWFAIQGALDDLIAVHLRYAAVYAWLSPENRLRGLTEYFLTTRVVAVTLPLVVFGAITLWRTNRPLAILLASWTLLVVALATAQNRFYAYHWLPLLPAWTLLGAAALHAMRSSLKTLATVVTGIILLHAIAPVVLEEARFLSWMAGRTDRAAYYDGYGEVGDDMRAERWLREQGQPGKVVVFGFHPAVAWLSQRETVSRFGYSLPLMMGDGLDVRDQYRAEFLRAIEATPPRYILVGVQSEQIFGATMTLDDFPELADLVRQSFREAARFGRIVIYESSR